MRESGVGDAPRVAVICATYRRPLELERMLACAAAQTVRPVGAWIFDNAADPALREICRSAPLPAHYQAAPDNPGCGHGLRAGARAALEREPGLTHLLYVDDDVEFPPDTIEKLMQPFAGKGVWAVVPLLGDREGRLDGGPGLRDRRLNRQFKALGTVGEAQRWAPERDLPVAWFRGPCSLVSTAAIREAGLHRGDFWMLGEDIEFSLRLSGTGRCLLHTGLEVRHVPPRPQGEGAGLRHRMKFSAMLQNLAYMASRLRHARVAWTYLPSHLVRYLRTFGGPQALAEAACCLWNGIVRGEPAGGRSGVQMRERMVKAEARRAGAGGVAP